MIMVPEFQKVSAAMSSSRFTALTIRATSIKNFLQKRYFFFPASFPALAAAAFSARKVDVFSHIGPRNAAMVVAARAFADSSATISPALALRASDAACGGKKGREGAHEYN